MKHRKRSRPLTPALSAVILTAYGQSGGAKKEPATTVAGGAAEETETTKPTGEIGHKTELNVVIAADLSSLDVHGVNSNIVGEIGTHIYEPLFAMGTNYEPAGVLADSYTISEGGKAYTIKLRQGAKLHNGQEMTADGMTASMSRRLELSSKVRALPAGTVFEEAGDYTITMTLPEVYADALAVVVASIQFPAIYPKSVIDSAGTEGITEYIGTGPYKLDEWKQDQYIHSVRYEDYAQSAGEFSSFIGEKLAVTPDIYSRVVTDDSTRVTGAQTGQYDIAEEMSQERYQEFFGNSSLKFYVKAAGIINLFFNTTKGIMASPQVRQAIMACLNCGDIMLASYEDPNLYVLNPGWCNPGDAMWGNDAGSKYYNQNNIGEAKELLIEAGYNNEEIAPVTTPDYGEMYNATLVVQVELQGAGIDAVVESYDFVTFMEHRTNPGQLSLYITSNRYNLNPAQLPVLTKDRAGLDYPEIDEGIAAIRMASSPEESPTKWDDLQEFLYEYGAVSVLGHYSGLMVIGVGVEGFNFFDFPPYWNVRVPAQFMIYWQVADSPPLAFCHINMYD